MSGQLHVKQNAVFQEFRGDKAKMAAEIVRLRAELATAADLVRPFAVAWEFQEKYLPDSADLTARYFWKPNSNTGDIPGISFADGQAAAEWLSGQGVAG